VALLYVPSPIPYQPHDPSWRQPLYLHLGPLWSALRDVLGELRGRVLDIGCGMQPYRSMVGADVTEYVGVDREGALSRPTVVGTAEALPFPDGSFDAVLSTQVLEHLPDPRRALDEAARVLRVGGTLVLTVPGVWPTHEAPHDYWRFTRHGVERLLRDHGIDVGIVRPLGGLWAAVGQMANLELQRRRFARDLVPVVNVVARWLDRRGAAEDLALAWFATGTRAR